jgi:hypothetical protein
MNKVKEIKNGCNGNQGSSCGLKYVMPYFGTKEGFKEHSKKSLKQFKNK